MKGSSSREVPDIRRHAACQQASTSVKELRLEDMLRALLANILHWLLVNIFAGLQDAVLAIGSLRRVAAFALVPRCRAAVLQRLLKRQQNRVTFDSMPYFVSADAQKLLLHGSMHGLMQAPQVATSLPAVGRILLQTGAKGTWRFQQAVAAALANQLGASLLVIDDSLLKGISKMSLGADALEAEGPAALGLLGFMLSFFLSGGKMAFVWDVVAQVCRNIQRPLVVLVVDVETTLCSTYERWTAFEAAMGSGCGGDEILTDHETELATGLVQRPYVLLGGCGLSDSAVQNVAQLRRSSSRTALAGTEEEQHAAAANGGGSANPFPPGSDDSLSSLLPSAADIALALQEDKPTASRLLTQLFPTCVKLQPPADSAAAARHAQQLLKDTAAAAKERSYRCLSELAAARNIQVPPSKASIYAEQKLGASDWAKVLAWAVSFESVRLRAAEHSEGQSEEQPVCASDTSTTSSIQLPAPEAQTTASSAAATADTKSGRTTIASARSGLRRVRSTSSATGEYFLPKLQASSQPSSPTASSFHLTAASKALSVLKARLSALLQQPADSSVAKDSQLSSGLAVSRVFVDASTSSAPSPAGKAAAASNAAMASHSGSVLQLQLLPAVSVSEEALQYGVAMLKRAGGGVSHPISVDNIYERKLLAEVIQPQDAGAGFSDVGALSNVKEALREAVQLPLQHPHLFVRGSLKQSCRGILLFGPPGTGKTLLARAAAAECGAAFLAVSPSTIASKWLGDGVRYVRAVFSLAAKISPCVIFVDEVDAILGRRNSHGEHEALREMKNEFFSQWDGIRSGVATASGPRVMVLGATNRPGDLDEAVLRRFSRRLFCDLPNKDARAAILQVMLEEESLADDVEAEKVAAGTDGFSGSDLRQLCVSAAMRPVRELLAASGKSATADASRKGKQKQVSASSRPSQRKTAASAADSSHGQPAAVAKSPAASSGGGGGGAAGPVAQQPGTAVDDATRVSVQLQCTGSCGPVSVVLTCHTDQQALVPSNSAEAPGKPDRANVLVGRLLEECEAVAAQATTTAADVLRPITAADFDAALADVAPSVAADSAMMSDLRAWNLTYGEGGTRSNGWDPKLTYFT